MTAAEFRDRLAGRITDAQAAALRAGEGLYISDFNRDVMLRMLENDASEAGELAEAGDVSEESVRELSEDLEKYLAEYMADHPEGHKWIIMACLYLTFIEGLPMHPQHAANWQKVGGVYLCRHKVEDSITCRYCVCKKGV